MQAPVVSGAVRHLCGGLEMGNNNYGGNDHEYLGRDDATKRITCSRERKYDYPVIS